MSEALMTSRRITIVLSRVVLNSLVSHASGPGKPQVRNYFIQMQHQSTWYWTTFSRAKPTRACRLILS